MREATYTTREERQRLCDIANGDGEFMLHDEVRQGINTLVFEIAPADPPGRPINPHLTRLKQLTAKENSERITDGELLELVRLERENQRFINRTTNVN